jgi:hypothetical protein
MTEKASEPTYTVTVEPDGRLVLSEDVVEEYVLQTLGCNLWVNGKDQAVAMRLLRGHDHPPYLIERVPGAGGRPRAEVQAGAFLNKVGLPPEAVAKTYACLYFKKYHLLAFQMPDRIPQEDGGSGGIFDDFPAMED